MTATYATLNAERITQALKQFSQDNLTSPYQGTITCFESIDSTNAWLLKHGAEGDVCLSETQTAGRGRRNNTWVSPDSGNIYLSYCCYFDESVAHRSLLGLVAGIATAEALQDAGLKGHGIKWPNDIFCQNKKLGGILIQTAENYRKFIVGIGLNVSLPNESLQQITQAATCLEDALQGRPVPREQLVILMIQHLLSHTELFARLPFAAFEQSWQRWDILQEREVEFQHQDQHINGIVSGIDKHGRIGIKHKGAVEFFSAAEIKLKKPNIVQ